MKADRSRLLPLKLVVVLLLLMPLAATATATIAGFGADGQPFTPSICGFDTGISATSSHNCGKM